MDNKETHKMLCIVVCSSYYETHKLICIDVCSYIERNSQVYSYRYVAVASAIVLSQEDCLQSNHMHLESLW